LFICNLQRQHTDASKKIIEGTVDSTHDFLSGFAM
jgi:hypothetical protein